MKLYHCALLLVILANLMTNTVFAQKKGGRKGRDQSFRWRDKTEWCDEARNEPLELIETCYANGNCCRESSQCADGCCGEDSLCHETCFDESGVNLYNAPINIGKHKALRIREPCRELVYNNDEWEIDMYRAGFAWFLFLGFTISCCTGIICFCRARSFDKRERKQIYKAQRSLIDKIRKMEGAACA